MYALILAITKTKVLINTNKYSVIDKMHKYWCIITKFHKKIKDPYYNVNGDCLQLTSCYCYQEALSVMALI